MELSLRDFERAAKRLEGIIHRTDLDYSATFSCMAGGEVWMKCENRQKTGSFKIRGAANKIGALTERGVKRWGVFAEYILASLPSAEQAERLAPGCRAVLGELRR